MNSWTSVSAYVNGLPGASYLPIVVPNVSLLLASSTKKSSPGFPVAFIPHLLKGNTVDVRHICVTRDLGILGQ